MNEVAEQLQKINAKLDRIDGRLDGIDGRLDRMDRRFDAMDGRFDAHDRRFDANDRRFDGNDSRFDRIEAQLHKQGVLLESMSADLKQTMEAVVGNRQVMDQSFAALRTQIDERVQPIEWAVRRLAKQSATRRDAKPRRKTRA